MTFPIDIPESNPLESIRHFMDKMTPSWSHPGIKWYSKQGTWSLFVLCAFPFHVWTLVLALRDVSWVSERTNAWDALGVISYGLIFAFVESAAAFLAIALLGWLVPARWDEARRIALLGVLVFAAAAWAIYGQAYFVWDLQLPSQLIQSAARSGHPFRLLFSIELGLVIPTVLLPALVVLRSDRFFRLVQATLERLAVLVGFYLFLDLLGLLIVIIRNISRAG